MVDTVAHIANVAAMEDKLPNKREESTLWEGDELTVRFLLEEGKLNLCLRLLHEVKSETAARAGDAAWLTLGAHAAGLSGGADALGAKLGTFEQSMGALMRCAFEHVEAVQTTDLAELFVHVSEVLAAAG